MKLPQFILITGIRLYRWLISPAKAVVFGPLGRCRYSPTCSGYAQEAILIHGPAKGSWLAVKRLCRCHPWGECGEDPVPPLPARVSAPPLQPDRISSHPVSALDFAQKPIPKVRG